MSDYDALEKVVQERIKTQLVPDTQIEVVLERILPPMPFRESSLKAAIHAQRIYSEIGSSLKIVETAVGGATDAAFAAIETKVPVIEGFGLKGFGAHSSSAEYINISSIEPRLYLLTRMVMDADQGKVPSPAN